jgi:hypothetical protein
MYKMLINYRYFYISSLFYLQLRINVYVTTVIFILRELYPSVVCWCLYYG